MKKTQIVPVVFLLVIVIVFTCSWSSFRNEDGQGHANIVTYPTPREAKQTTLLFSRRFSGKNGTAYNSSPILTDNRIYVVSENVLYEMDEKGAILRQLTLSHHMDTVCQMLLEKDCLYIPLSSGIVECVNKSDMKSLWRSESFGGQSLASLYYHNGCLYSGTTIMENAENTSGLFYCLNAVDGSTVWTYEDETPCGYYWSGAVSYGNALFFAGDNGKLISHSLLTADVYHTYQLSEYARLRTGITYDADTDSLYTAANDGTLYKIQADKAGTVLKISDTKIVPDASFINCTSTPTIYRGRIYLGCIADGEGCLCVLDAENLSLIYRAGIGHGMEVKSSPLLSTAYEKEYNSPVVLYFSGNAPPGGIYTLEDYPQAAGGEPKLLFSPEQKQYCLSSIAAGKDGRLYYSNDSGTFFAVGSGTTPENIAAPTLTPDSQPENTPDIPAVSQKKKISVAAPKNFSAKKKKNVWRLSWKTGSKKYQTILYTRTGSGTWKKQNMKKKTTYKFTIRTGTKKVRARLRCRMKKNGKWIYSKYTKNICFVV